VPAHSAPAANGPQAIPAVTNSVTYCQHNEATSTTQRTTICSGTGQSIRGKAHGLVHAQMTHTSTPSLQQPAGMSNTDLRCQTSQRQLLPARKVETCTTRSRTWWGGSHLSAAPGRWPPASVASCSLGCATRSRHRGSQTSSGSAIWNLAPLSGHGWKAATDCDLVAAPPPP
jgi:hypothetical protein